MTKFLVTYYGADSTVQIEMWGYSKDGVLAGAMVMFRAGSDELEVYEA